MSWVEKKKWNWGWTVQFHLSFCAAQGKLRDTGIHIAGGVMLYQALMEKERAVDIWSGWWMFEVLVFMGWEGVMSRAIVLKMWSMNIEVQVSFSIMVSSGYLPSSGIDGSYGSSIPFFFFFLRNLHVAVVQSLSSVWLFATHMDCSPPGFPVLHYLQSLLKFMSIESVMLPKYLILSILFSILAVSIYSHL